VKLPKLGYIVGRYPESACIKQ